MPTRSTLIERIVKLFRLGDKDANTTEHEMMLAITTAKKLMAQHNVSLAEVAIAAGNGAAARINIVLKRHVAYTRKIRNLASYDMNVARATEILTSTRALVSRSVRGGAHYSQMQFVGEETDAELAGELFIVILESVRRAARSTYGTGWSQLHTSYALGFSARLIDRAQAMNDVPLLAGEAQTLAMVLASKTEAIARWMEENIKEAPTPRKVTISAAAYGQGYRDGALYNLATHKTLR